MGNSLWLYPVTSQRFKWGDSSNLCGGDPRRPGFYWSAIKGKPVSDPYLTMWLESGDRCVSGERHSRGSLHTANCHSERTFETSESTREEGKEIRINRWRMCVRERRRVSDIGMGVMFDVFCQHSCYSISSRGPF